MRGKYKRLSELLYAHSFWTLVLFALCVLDDGND